MYSQEIQDRFWSKVNKTDNCWEWTGGLNQNGYGEFNPYCKNIKAHRFSFQNHHNRLIQEGLCIMHICDNRKCVNPNHLSEGTHQDNMIDMCNKGRGNKPKGEKHHLSKLTEKQVKEIREKYSQGGTTYKKLGEEYGVEQTVIGKIVRYESWAHI
jgi:hypothetical protein